MAISDKTRKVLWAKSGNRCSICKTELFSQKEEPDKLNIGEECHIISSKVKGPRHKNGLENYDSYENLILLCRNHHKEIDELVDTFTEELLSYIKTNHENWVSETLNKSLEKEKKQKPKFLKRITSGKELLNIVSDSYGYETDYDEVDNEEEAEYIGQVIQSLIDYGDISGMVEPYDKVKMSIQLKELEEKGYYIFGERAVRKMKFTNGDSDNWPIATLIIKKKNSKDVINQNQN